ncbi:MAG: hypothetical protein DWQ31_13785 [Planctomycetota bacterium]|nr:MAG: hypothetical protein DWQ31_13785 [Planctomycetota bacterium]REK40828.1 MAG: hypothetical protein DWQ46_15135 [Planctomycetota bacterium]
MPPVLSVLCDDAVLCRDAWGGRSPVGAVASAPVDASRYLVNGFSVIDWNCVGKRGAVPGGALCPQPDASLAAWWLLAGARAEYN